MNGLGVTGIAGTPTLKRKMVRRNGRLIYQASQRERRIFESWRQNTLPQLRIRGLAESAAGRKSTLAEAKRIYRETEALVRDAERHVVNLRERLAERESLTLTLPDAMIAILMIEDGVPLTYVSEATQKVLREVRSESLALHGDDLLRESRHIERLHTPTMPPFFDDGVPLKSGGEGGARVVGLGDEVARLAMGKRKAEASAGSSMGQLTRKADAPVHPMDALSQEQDKDMARRAAGGDKDAADRLARIGAMRRRQQFASNVANEADGMNMADGKASGVLDDIAPATDLDRKQADADTAATDTTEDDAQVAYNQDGDVWSEGDGPKFDENGDPLEEDNLVFSPSSYGDAAGSSGMGGMDEVAVDHGSHAAPTFAGEGAAGSGTMPPSMLKKSKQSAAKDILFDQNTAVDRVVVKG